jgi:integrase-like protein
MLEFLFSVLAALRVFVCSRSDTALEVLALRQQVAVLKRHRPRPTLTRLVERLIGTMRREFLDQLLFWNGRDLERKLAEFQAYYNAARSHASLEGHTPLAFASGHTAVPADLNHVRWVSHCRGLVQLHVVT